MRVYADFNDRTLDGACWNLWYGGEKLAKSITSLRLAIGDQILLYQDEGDFEVVAVVDFRYVHVLGQTAWVADPDWPTFVRK